MIGQLFGNYRAISLLGKGGMGSVYLAEHPEIGRKVAVKVLHTELSADAQLLGRFLNEARAANAIRHPNIIEILDSGMLPHGQPFLVMEFLDGESLATRVGRLGRVPLPDALEFTYQTASALGAAHKQGIVHRDLKPDNLFVVPGQHEGDRERIKVLDFGIAKLQRTSPGDSVKTRTGMLMGTPVYMSPEQCRGTKSVDLRSDVYSLGIILYEMLVGRPPFVSEGFGDLVNMHLNVEPAPIRSWLPTIPEDVEQLVQRALAKNPDDRFQTMAELQEALKALSGPGLVVRGSSPDLGSVPPRVATDPTMAAPPVRTTFSTGTGEIRAGSRSRGFKGLLVMVAATAVTVMGVGYYLRDRGSTERVGSEKVGAPPAVALPIAATAADAAAERTGAPDVGVNKMVEQAKPPAVLKGQPTQADSPVNKTKSNSAKSTTKPSGKVGAKKKRPADEEPAKL